MPRLLRLIASQSANLFKARGLSDKLARSPARRWRTSWRWSWSDTADSSEQKPEVFHYRRDRDEVDLVLESRAGEICAIEVKSSSKIREKDWAALQRLRDARSNSFICGVLFYTGAQTIKLSDRI
jgi:predicted AAA+ superfamily ATPase